MPPLADGLSAQQAIGMGATYMENATVIGQVTGIPPPGGGQLANVQLANRPVNVLAAFLRGLGLQGQAAAGLAVP